MLSFVGAWLMANLVGIQPAPNSTAWGRVLVRPYLVGQLAFASGMAETPHGRVEARWALADQGSTAASVTVDVTIPPSTVADVYVPVPQFVSTPDGLTVHDAAAPAGIVPVWDGGAFVAGDPGVTGAQMLTGGEYGGAAVVVTVTAGRYQFVLQGTD